MIHPTAIIHPKAEVDITCQIGPFCVIDAGVTLGAECVLSPNVYLTGQTRIGSHNRFHAGSIIGDAPQDLKYQSERTGLVIGNHNVFREHVTIHRSNKPEEDTVLGSHNFLMAHSHVGHNSILGNHVILANGALIAGHVEIEDRAFISGNCLVHQFVRIGTLSFMQGGAGISKDLPPYTTARGNNGICGLNVVGLRRSGVNSADRLELKRLYHHLFRTSAKFGEALNSAEGNFQSVAARHMIRFLKKCRRGVCADTGLRGNSRDEEES